MNAKLQFRFSVGSHRFDFPGRILLMAPIQELVIPPKAAPPAPRSNGQGCRVMGTARAKSYLFAITINHSAIGVVPVDLERGVVAGADLRELANTSEEISWAIN